MDNNIKNKYLLNFLKRKSLQEFSVYNITESSDLKRLFTALKTSCFAIEPQGPLKTLRIYNMIDKYLVNYLLDIISYETLTTLILKNSIDVLGFKLLSERLQSNTSITTLDLSCNNLIHEDKSNEGVNHISVLLCRNTTINTLNLSRNFIEEMGGKYLSGALKKNSNLTKLDLAINLLEDQGGQEVLLSLKRNSTLLSLDLSKNNIKNCIPHIFDSLRVNSTLTNLDLKGNEIGNPQKVTILQNSFKLHPELTIDLRNNIDVSVTKVVKQKFHTFTRHLGNLGNNRAQILID